MSVERAGAASSRARSDTIERGLLGVIPSRRLGVPSMSGFGGKADVLRHPLECPEIAISGHSGPLVLLDFIGSS